MPDKDEDYAFETSRQRKLDNQENAMSEHLPLVARRMALGADSVMKAMDLARTQGLALHDATYSDGGSK